MWQRGSDGGLKAISRVQAWIIHKAASELADIRVLSLRASHHGAICEPAPAHHTSSATLVCARSSARHATLRLAQGQPGWSRSQMLYVSVGGKEARQLMQDVPE